MSGLMFLLAKLGVDRGFLARDVAAPIYLKDAAGLPARAMLSRRIDHRVDRVGWVFLPPFSPRFR